MSAGIPDELSAPGRAVARRDADISPYDVAVVGAGVVGTAIARELSRHELRCVLIEAADDVGTGTSKANTAILHTGFDAKPGTLEAELVRRGCSLLREYSSQAGIPVERTGALLVAWTEEQELTLPELAHRARQNGYPAVRSVGSEELYVREPHLGAGALGALEIPDESIICPWTVPLAFATEALLAGAQLRLGTTVRSVSGTESGHRLHTDRGPIDAGWVVNAAGLSSALVDRMFGHAEFDVIPRRGQLIVFDKLARSLVSSILLPVPTTRGKGVLVAPTVYGNVLLGPTAEDLDDPSDTATTAAGLTGLLEQGNRILPELIGEEVTASYAGLRAATEHPDYQIRIYGDQRYACVGGIRSTGLTASMAIAEYVCAGLADAGLAFERRCELPGPPRMANLGEAFCRPYQDTAQIAADPAYGRIVCHCERVSEGEIRDALQSAIPAHNLDGLRRRTRAGNGRCQGFFCGAQVARMLEHPDGLG